MDPVLHTIVATGLMFCCYSAGHWFGFKRGEFEGLLRLCMTIDAIGIEIDEDEGTVTIERKDGTKTEL